MSYELTPYELMSTELLTYELLICGWLKADRSFDCGYRSFGWVGRFRGVAFG